VEAASRVNGAAPQADGIFIIGTNPFNRTAATGNHAQDFRWMIDIENDIHPFPVPKHSNRVRPRLTINKGIFYTHHKTNTRFNAHHVQGVPVRPLASVAEVMAARIYLAATGSVDVVIDGEIEDSLPQVAGVQYQLDVFNLCDPSAHPVCDFRPGHPRDERRRNDFFMYYNAISIPPGDQFHLIAAHPTQTSEITGICLGDGEHGTDPAPCGPSGFGRSDTFGT
jgi:hypothetical protein